MANTEADKETVRLVRKYLKEKGMNTLKHDSEGQPVHPDPSPDAHDAGLVTEVGKRERAITMLTDTLNTIKITVPDGEIKTIAIAQFELTIGAVRLAFESKK